MIIVVTVDIEGTLVLPTVPKKCALSRMYCIRINYLKYRFRNGSESLRLRALKFKFNVEGVRYWEVAHNLRH